MKKYLLLGCLAFAIYAFPASASANIAVDSTSNITASNWYNCGTSCSWNHTVSGSDTMLLVTITSNAGDVVTGVTYNSVSMTQLAKQQRSDAASVFTYIYYLIAPSSGTHSIAVTLSSADANFMGAATSYTGVAQTAPEANATASAVSGTATINVTTLTNGAWISGMFYNGSGATMSAGNNTVFRGGSASSAIAADSGSGMSTAGSYSLNANNVSSWIAVAAAIAPSSPLTENITGTGTPNRIPKFTTTTTVGNSLFSDDGSNITLTAGNFLMQINSLIDTVSSGILNFGTTYASTMNFGRSGQNMIINSSVGIGTSTPATTLDVNGGVRASTINTATNCTSSASPAACGSASSGSVAVPTGTDNVVVNTTAVTANSQILLTENFGLGSRLGVTCNTANSRRYAVSAFTAGTSFTIKASGNVTTNPACISYLIIN